MTDSAFAEMPTPEFIDRCAMVRLGSMPYDGTRRRTRRSLSDYDGIAWISQ